MIDVKSDLDLSQYKWQEFHYEDENGYLVHHDQTILGYDKERGTLDFLVRWGTDGGHCMVPAECGGPRHGSGDNGA